MNRRPGFSKAIRERTVRLVLTSEHDHPSRWAVTQSMALKIGCTPETLRSWVKKMKINASTKPGVTADRYQRTKELEREVRELKRANEILHKVAAFFAQAELDRKPRSWRPLSISIAINTVSSPSAGNCR
ncbi:MAG: transposase [Candidatus Reddybacter sp.]